jgi:5-deoxy-glucuronate isomerase
MVMLGGTCNVDSKEGEWKSVGRAEAVFDGRPHVLYSAGGHQVRCDRRVRLRDGVVTRRAEERYRRGWDTDEVEVEIRGGGNATRQINHMLKPDFPAHRLLIVEVYTPAGNWSSYPHKRHDVHNPPGEVDLEEIYLLPGGPAGLRDSTRIRPTAGGRTITVRDRRAGADSRGVSPGGRRTGTTCIT